MTTFSLINTLTINHREQHECFKLTTTKNLISENGGYCGVGFKD